MYQRYGYYSYYFCQKHPPVNLKLYALGLLVETIYMSKLEKLLVFCVYHRGHRATVTFISNARNFHFHSMQPVLIWVTHLPCYWTSLWLYSNSRRPWLYRLTCHAAAHLPTMIRYWASSLPDYSAISTLISLWNDLVRYFHSCFHECLVCFEHVLVISVRLVLGRTTVSSTRGSNCLAFCLFYLTLV